MAKQCGEKMFNVILPGANGEKEEEEAGGGEGGGGGRDTGVGSLTV